MVYAGLVIVFEPPIEIHNGEPQFPSAWHADGAAACSAPDPASTELRPVRSVRFKFIDQSLDFLQAAPLSMTTRFVFKLHEPS